MPLFTTTDWVVVAVYFAILLGVILATRRKQDTTTDYFLAGRNVGFFAIGSSIFASNIGSEHVVGLAGIKLVGSPGIDSRPLTHSW